MVQGKPFEHQFGSQVECALLDPLLLSETTGTRV